MASIMRSGAYAAPAEAVWTVVGDFHDLAAWHPGIVSQTRDGDIRHLHDASGDTMVERFLGKDGMSYAYEIVSGPLPVDQYRSVLSVAPSATGCVVVWCSTFEPRVSAAFRLVAGIYDAGLAALEERFAPEL